MNSPAIVDIGLVETETGCFPAIFAANFPPPPLLARSFNDSNEEVGDRDDPGIRVGLGVEGVLYVVVKEAMVVGYVDDRRNGALGHSRSGLEKIC